MTNSSETRMNTGKPAKTLDRTFCTAPMMDWSDRHCRYFWRQLSKEAVLYTEMVTTGALIHGDRESFLQYNDTEHPIALQLGGSNPSELAKCTEFAEQWGYDEVNLNVGCPSDRVQNNMIGACLMGHPELVRDCLSAMKDASSTSEITVKHRIGIDDQDSYQQLVDFVGTVAESGVNTFIVHARKAILQGLSPKENREIPPLVYPFVYDLKKEFPDLEIIINGGIKTHEQIEQHLKHIDGVMIGREAYQNPWILAEVDQRYYQSDANIPTKHQVAQAMTNYIDQHVQQGGFTQHIVRHMLNLFQGQPGARKFRRFISENAPKSPRGSDLLLEALELVPA